MYILSLYTYICLSIFIEQIYLSSKFRYVKSSVNHHLTGLERKNLKKHKQVNCSELTLC